MIEYIINKFGRIDVIVNNAGIDLVKIFTEVTDDEWNYVINTNLYSVFCVTQEGAKHMINQKSGNIINISSIFGIIGASCESIYSVSKAGIDGLTKSLAKEFAPYVNVNAVAPGWILTEKVKELDDNLDNVLTQDESQKILVNRFAEPEDICNLVLFLASDKSNYIDSEIIKIDGGSYE